jgi:cbb3-type cytochrome oxidase maturation protein
MEVIYITMGITVLLAVFFLLIFFKNVKEGQYEDTYTPSVRMLFDDELVQKPEGKEKRLKETDVKTVNNN